ncbi:MAG: alpha/beta hydrolase, partial [Pseudomonadota bacterium]
ALNAVFQRDPEAVRAVQTRAAELSGVSKSNAESTLERWFGHSDIPERAACRAWLQSVDPQGYQAAYRVFAAEPGLRHERLKQLSCHALFMTGDLEPNATAEMSRKMAGRAPLGQCRIVSGAAHMMPMTHPQTVASALRSLHSTAKVPRVSETLSNRG